MGAVPPPTNNLHKYAPPPQKKNIKKNKKIYVCPPQSVTASYGPGIISVPSPVFRGKKHYDESETLQSVYTGMRFASGTIKSASLIL